MSDVTRDGIAVQPVGQSAEQPPRLAVIIGGQPGHSSEWRIDDPDRVMRAWSMLTASGQELHQVNLPPGAESRLGRQLRAVIAELERSLSPALTAELHRLLSASAEPTPAELRVAYAGVSGWTGGLVVAILSQLEEAGAGPGAASALEARPDH